MLPHFHFHQIHATPSPSVVMSSQMLRSFAVPQINTSQSTEKLF